MKNNKKVYDKLPKDTNGEWVESEGWYTAHHGDYVPLQGVNRGGSKNVYFKGKTNQKYIEKEAKGIYKLFYYLSVICIISFIATIFIEIMFQPFSFGTMLLIIAILSILIVISSMIILKQK